MKENKVSRLIIFVGPNGAGKTTLFEQLSHLYPLGYFVNADVIEKELATKGYLDLCDYNIDPHES